MCTCRAAQALFEVKYKRRSILFAGTRKLFGRVKPTKDESAYEWCACGLPGGKSIKMTQSAPVKRGAQLSAQGKVSRMVQSLARSFFAGAEPEPEEESELIFVSEKAVTRTIEAWQERSSYLPRELLSDPAWRMLLELLQAEIQDRHASLASLCKVSEAPASTATRWLKALERQALVVRRPDPLDPDDEMVELSRKGSSVLRRYFHAIEHSSDPSKDYY